MKHWRTRVRKAAPYILSFVLWWVAAPTVTILFYTLAKD